MRSRFATCLVAVGFLSAAPGADVNLASPEPPPEFFPQVRGDLARDGEKPGSDMAKT